MRVVYILNPAAGGAGPDLLAEVAAAASDAGLEGPVRLTAAPGHATTLAREAAAEGATVVVAVGGDGTANEVAAGLVGTPAAFAVLPAGTGDDLARELGMPAGWRRGLAALPRAEKRRIDVCFANKQPFFQVAGAGLDGYVNQLRLRERWLSGPLAYTKCAIQGLLSYEPVACRLVLDGEAWSQRALAVTIANGHTYGGGMRIAPGARNDDGAFDVAIIGDLGKLDALRMFPTVYWGGHVRHPKFTLRRGTHLLVESERPVPIHVDGTLAGMTPLECSIQPGALEVLSLRP